MAKPPLIVMPLPSSETRFMPSLCRGINPINSSISVKSNACISQGQSHEGILNQRRDLYIKDSYVFFFLIRSEGMAMNLDFIWKEDVLKD